MEKLKKLRLGDCIKEINEKTTVNNQYEVLSVTKDGIFSQEEYFKKQIASENNIGYKVLRKNNLVFSTMNLWMGSLDVLTNYEIGIVSPAYKIFEFNEKLMLPEYGNYFMKSYYMLEQYKNFSEQGASIVRRNLDLKSLLNIEIIIPSIKEQEKIVRILKNVEQVTEKYEELLKQKKQFIESIFVEMFENKDLKQIKLEEIAEIYDGTHQTPRYTESGIDFISVENIDDIYNSNKYITKEAYKEYKHKAEIKDLFMTRIGTIGKCAIVTQGKELAYYVSLALIKPDKNRINSLYLKQCLECGSGRKEIRKRTLTYATPIKINKEDIGKIKILYADIELQNKFAEIVKHVDKQKFELEELIKNYKSLKKGLMQNLLTGKVRVKI